MKERTNNEEGEWGEGLAMAKGQRRRRRRRRRMVKQKHSRVNGRRMVMDWKRGWRGFKGRTGEQAGGAGSGEENENLRSELEKLECHFTWGLTAQDVNLNFLEVKFRDVVSLPEDALPQEINLKGRTYNHLAYVKHLQGCNQEALGYLGKAVEENADNAKSCIVTYGNLAWVHHLMGDDREAETYLRRLEEINESFPTPPPAALHCKVFGEKAWSLLKFSKNH
ncbi:hypothetical protein SKAU_G00180520 [Synaphobranchus kaupii]|uniref:Uncharacterized protein n=1 Tax=Synaphobranchus kaupii TaxID=118154 RepID=A0A9Q1FMV0_SYNKA|nr:hypothetical protein SKAU_G00180490 [Synaphobranchus kaupii]KAJ8361527.1 hypothetical protein SKAU_G00180520 [Synaphobranchus kaupii]